MNRNYCIFQNSKRKGRKKVFTCSIRLRTAKAGRGNPWAEVALCTPPEIGVLKSPALVPPAAPFADGDEKDMSKFNASLTFFSLLSDWFKLPFKTSKHKTEYDQMQLEKWEQTNNYVPKRHVNTAKRIWSDLILHS